jgi:hypothetical protein
MDKSNTPSFPLLVLMIGIILMLILICSGCYGAPLDTRNVEATGFRHSVTTPWGTTTIEAKKWLSREKIQTEK